MHCVHHVMYDSGWVSTPISSNSCVSQAPSSILHSSISDLWLLPFLHPQQISLLCLQLYGDFKRQNRSGLQQMFWKRKRKKEKSFVLSDFGQMPANKHTTN